MTERIGWPLVAQDKNQRTNRVLKKKMTQDRHQGEGGGKGNHQRGEKISAICRDTANLRHSASKKGKTRNQ